MEPIAINTGRKYFPMSPIILDPNVSIEISFIGIS